MRQRSVFLALVAAFAGTACQDDGRQLPEVIYVADQLAGDAAYTVDLAREDAVYYLAPGVATSRLSIMCPTLATMSFSEYVAGRIRPTGAEYRPNVDGLRLANGAVSFDGLSLRISLPNEGCVVDCIDTPSGDERCTNLCQEAE